MEFIRYSNQSRDKHLPPSTVIYVDVSVLLHAINYKHPELAEMIATYTPSSPNLDQLLTN
jgi:hypothetical protein